MTVEARVPRERDAPTDRLPRRAPVDDDVLVRRHREDDDGARERMIVRHLPLAKSLARHYGHHHDLDDDLVQVASLGLIKAVDRWDPDRGVPFPYFAVPTILGELRRYFRDATWSVRPPRRIQELTIAVERARKELGATRREPTPAELAVHLATAPERLREAICASEGRSARSLDAPAREEGASSETLGDFLGANDRGFAEAEARVTLAQLMAGLDDDAREVLRLRYDGDLAQAEIGRRIGCSQARVSRLIRASMKRLVACAEGEAPLEAAA